MRGASDLPEGAFGTKQLYYHFISLLVVCEKSDSWMSTRCAVKALTVVLVNYKTLLDLLKMPQAREM